MGFGFDHYDRFFGSGNDEVQIGVAAFVVGWVNNIFSVDQADTHAGNRVFERNVRQIKRHRGTSYRYNIGIVIRVGRDNAADDLRFKTVSVGK